MKNDMVCEGGTEGTGEGFCDIFFILIEKKNLNDPQELFQEGFLCQSSSDSKKSGEVVWRALSISLAAQNKSGYFRLIQMINT